MAIQSYILATGQAAEAAALLPGADQPSIGSIEFGAGHTLSDASTVGLETPLAPPQSTTQINYAMPVGGEAKLGYQVGGSAEFNFSEILLRLDDAGKTAYARIVDTLGDLNGKNASQILVGLLNVAYTNPPQASGLVATTAAPLAMLMATADNPGAVRLATPAQARAAQSQTLAVTPAGLAGLGIAPEATTAADANSITAAGIYTATDAIANAMANLPTSLKSAFTMTVEPAGAFVRQLIWGDGVAHIRRQTAAAAWTAWRRIGGVVETIWTADVARYDIPGDGWAKALLQLWASGGAGGNDSGRINGNITGGAGGDYVDFWLSPSDLPDFVAIDVGDATPAPPAGSGRVNPAAGSPTSFGSFTVAAGSGAGDGRYDGGRGGNRDGGDSVYGGGGGAGLDSAPGPGTPGVSTFGGNGGAANAAINGGVGVGVGSPGVAPGGGGGAGLALGGAGARGEVRLTLFY